MDFAINIQSLAAQLCRYHTFTVQGHALPHALPTPARKFTNHLIRPRIVAFCVSLLSVCEIGRLIIQSLVQYNCVSISQSGAVLSCRDLQLPQTSCTAPPSHAACPSKRAGFPAGRQPWIFLDCRCWSPRHQTVFDPAPGPQQGSRDG